MTARTSSRDLSGLRESCQQKVEVDYPRPGPPLAKLDDELARLAAAIAQGGDLGSLLQALKAREATRDQLRAELVGLGQAPTVTVFDLRRFDREVRARLTDWQGVLPRQTMQARQIVQKLLVGRLAFTPGEDPEGRYYEFAGQGALDKLLTGIIRPSSMVTPAGFEPAISTLKGLRPGPG